MPNILLKFSFKPWDDVEKVTVYKISLTKKCFLWYNRSRYGELWMDIDWTRIGIKKAIKDSENKHNDNSFAKKI